MSNNPVLFVQYVTPNEILAAATILPVLSIVFLGCRFYVRYSRSVALGADDYLLIPALAFLIGWAITFIIGVHDRAFGYPTPDQQTASKFLSTAAQLAVTFLKLEFAMSIFLVLSFGFIKLSILFFYRRIFVATRDGWTSMTLWIAIALVSAWTLTFFLLSIVDCGADVTANWGSRENEITHCVNTYMSETALHTSEFITSVMVAVLPIPMIWQLHLTTVRKFQIIGLMMLAFLAVAISIVRLILLFDITTKAITFPIDHDLVLSTFYYFGLLEGSIAFIASCLPTVHVLANRASIATMVQSGRSLISLPFSSRSQRSGGSGESNDRGNTTVIGNIAHATHERAGSKDGGGSSSSAGLKPDRDNASVELQNLDRRYYETNMGFGWPQRPGHNGEWQQRV